MKNLYAINALYVNDSTELNQIWFIFALNDEECYDYVENNYSFMYEDKDEIMENKWEIWLEHDNYDWYYDKTIYG